MIPKIIEVILEKEFIALFFAFICLKYILFIATPVPPMTIRHTPIKKKKTIIIPIIAAINGIKIRKPIKTHLYKFIIIKIPAIT